MLGYTWLEMQTDNGDLAMAIDNAAFGMDAAQPSTTGTAALYATAPIVEGDRVLAQVNDDLHCTEWQQTDLCLR